MKIHDYKTDSGRDLILEYLDSLPSDERDDGFAVMKCMENNEFDKIYYKRWQKKSMKYILERATAYSI